jgi:hypothetical protein
VFVRFSIRIPAGTLNILTEVLRDFSQSLLTHVGIVSRVGHGRFLTNHFQLSGLVFWRFPALNLGGGTCYPDYVSLATISVFIAQYRECIFKYASNSSSKIPTFL